MQQDPVRARALFSDALALLSQQPADAQDLEEVAPALINLILAEALPYENSLRAATTPPLPLLDEPPRIQTLDDAIYYRPVLCRAALPYGLASFLWTDDDNDYRAQDLRARFIAALYESQRLATESVVDRYA